MRIKTQADVERLLSGQISKSKRLDAIISERGLSTTGFRSSLRTLCEEIVGKTKLSCGDPDCQDPGCLECCNPEEEIDYRLEGWFPNPVRPAAYRIRRDGERPTIELYEVENSVEISDHKLKLYSRMADDAEEVYIELHIIDRYDHEIIVLDSSLQRFISSEYFPEEIWKMKKKMRSKTKVQHHSPTVITKIDNRKARAIVQAVIELGLIQPGDF